MSVTYIGEELRRRVEERARWRCEYCLIGDEDVVFGCEVDHIISEKHGGESTEQNLALACFFCNRHKGSDVGSIVLSTKELVRFFNPRVDRWEDHFRLARSEIEPTTHIGEVTARILGFNHSDRLVERTYLIAAGRYPSRQR